MCFLVDTKHQSFKREGVILMRLSLLCHFIILTFIISCTNSGGGGVSEDADENNNLESNSPASESKIETTFNGFETIGGEGGDALIPKSEQVSNLGSSLALTGQAYTMNVSVDHSDEGGSENGPSDMLVSYYPALGGSQQQASSQDGEGNASIELQSEQYYMVSVDTPQYGKLKAVVFPKQGSAQAISKQSMAVNRLTTITADIYENISKNESGLALIHSQDIVYKLLENVAQNFYHKARGVLATSRHVAYFKSDDYRAAVSKLTESLISEVLTVEERSSEFESDRLKSIISQAVIIQPELEELVLDDLDGEKKCLITQDVCTRKPHRVGTFTDHHKEARVNPERCLQRSLEYHRWCRNSNEDVTTAEFQVDGETVASLTSKQHYSGCYITLNACNRDPSMIRTYLDLRRSASSEMEACMSRAPAMHRWCKNDSSSTSVARFYEKGVLVQEADSKDPYSGCYIEQSQCDRKPHLVGKFYNNHQNSSYDKERCLRRSKEFHNWCKNPTDSITTASFYQEGHLIASSRSDVPSSGCYIELNTCRSKPEKTGFLLDNNKGSSSNEDRCMQRVHEYHRWCKNHSTDVTKAFYYQSGTIQNETDSQTAYSGCFINQSTCRYFPNKVGLFYDNHQNSSGDQHRCMRRAHEYHRWCRNLKEDVTEAMYYDKSNLIQKVDSQRPYTGCFIEINTCNRLKDRVGLRLDNYQMHLRM